MSPNLFERAFNNFIILQRRFCTYGDSDTSSEGITCYFDDELENDIDDEVEEANAADDAFTHLEVGIMPTLRDAQHGFAKAMMAYRDTVLQDVMQRAMEQGADYPGKIGTSTEWGSKKPWVKTTTSVGTSSMMSVVSEDTGGMVQKFVDSGEEDTDVPPKEEVPRRKKKVVRKVKKQGHTLTGVLSTELTPKSSPLDERKEMLEESSSRKQAEEPKVHSCGSGD
jgi:hypothetical protein